MPGIGLQEMICRRCLAIELADTGLDFVREKEQTLWYKGSLVGTLRADFGMEERLIVERKAVINLEEVHLAQAKNQVIADNIDTSTPIRRLTTQHASAIGMR